MEELSLELVMRLKEQTSQKMSLNTSNHSGQIIDARSMIKVMYFFFLWYSRWTISGYAINLSMCTLGVLHKRSRESFVVMSLTFMNMSISGSGLIPASFSLLASSINISEMQSRPWPRTEGCQTLLDICVSQISHLWFGVLWLQHHGFSHTFTTIYEKIGRS